jgi:TRAP-type C4-dicarboxylate transport system permease small subunit
MPSSCMTGEGRFNMLEKIRKGYSKVTRIAMLVCMLSVAVMMSYGFVDVWGRFLFNHPLHGTFELSELLMVAVVFLSLASCQAQDRHMRVDFLFTIVSKRVRAVVESITCVCGIVVCGLLGWFSIGPAWYSWTIREVTWGIISFPVYPAKFVVVVGAGLLGVQLILDLAGIIMGSEIAK